MSRKQPRKYSAAEWWVLNATMKRANGTIIDITGAQEIRWTLSASEGSAALLEATLGDGVEIIDGVTGRADIILETDDHADIEAGTYWHACVVTLEDGRVSAQFHGPFTVEAATP